MLCYEKCSIFFGLIKLKEADLAPDYFLRDYITLWVLFSELNPVHVNFPKLDSWIIVLVLPPITLITLTFNRFYQVLNLFLESHSYNTNYLTYFNY